MDAEFVRVIKDHRLLLPGDRVLVAVSGGPDSIALLSLLHHNAAVLGIDLVAAHLDHGIRREGSQDAGFVARYCMSLGIALIQDKVDVPALARSGGEGLEAAGRRARRTFLRATAAAHSCAAIALGHHRGDQAETVLHRLLRGTGVSGLAAMALRRGPFIRPLLFFGRNELLAYLSDRRLAYVEDGSNSDLTFTRNRIRHELLPLMAEFNPRIEEHLASLSWRIADEEDYWRQQVASALRSATLSVEGGLQLDRQSLLGLHPALRLRVLRMAFASLRGDLLELSSRHLEAVVGLLLGARPQGELHLPRTWVGRRYDRLLLRSAAPVRSESFAVDIPGPGSYSWPGGGRFEFSLEEAAGREGLSVVEFAAESIQFPLTVRTFVPGDRFCPAGGVGSKKLKDFFIDAKIPSEARRCCPLLVGPEILWVVGLRRCSGYRLKKGGGRVLRCLFLPSGGETIGL